MISRLVASAFRPTWARGFCTSTPPPPPEKEPVDFFARDFEEMKRADYRLQFGKAYLKAVDLWKKPLEKKQRRQKRIEAIKAAFVAPL